MTRPVGGARRVLRWLLTAYAFWLGMMAVHELGHVVGAAATGGRVLDVSIPLLGFSQTIVWPNPSPRVVTWSGPVAGALLPVVAWAAAYRTRAGVALQAFAGWCLVANGTYVGAGWVEGVGDAGDLVRLGTPRVLMIAFGVALVSGGLFLWHLIGAREGRR